MPESSTSVELPTRPVKAGDWVLLASSVRGYVRSPYVVVHATTQRVYYANDVNEDALAFCSVKTVLYVCDSAAQANKLYVAIQANAHKTHVMQRELQRRHDVAQEKIAKAAGAHKPA